MNGEGGRRRCRGDFGGIEGICRELQDARMVAVVLMMIMIIMKIMMVMGYSLGERPAKR